MAIVGLEAGEALGSGRGERKSEFNRQEIWVRAAQLWELRAVPAFSSQTPSREDEGPGLKVFVAPGSRTMLVRV